jgi:[ribosomal protein S5]-alanine N-acetyltransferase
MILETDRLTLRPLVSTDVEAVASYSMKPEFIRFLPLPPQTMESAAQFVEQAVANGQPDPKGDWLFAIQIREEPRLLGTIRIGVRSAEHRQGDLGYAVHPDHWGKGFATEALRRILEFGFENLSLERIWATADVRNVASWRVMEKGWNGAGRTHASPPACPWCVAGFGPLCSHQRYVTVALIC